MWNHLFGVLIFICAMLTASAMPNLEYANRALQTNDQVVRIDSVEYQILKNMYNALNGTHWKWKSDYASNGLPWDFTKPGQREGDPCRGHWQGLYCGYACPNNVCKIITMDMRGMGLSGELPAGTFNFTDMLFMYLSENEIMGQMPSVDQLPMLSLLNLSYNSLSGTIPACLGKATQLNLLYLSFNHLIGSLPDSFTQLTQLQYLYLLNNDLTGTLPANIGNLQELLFLNLGVNRFRGTLPASISQLTKLELLFLNNNTISGPFPAYLPYSLQKMSLECNRLTGRVPQIFERFQNLSVLKINDNFLTGPPPICLSTLRHLEILQLHLNQFTGPIGPLFDPAVQVKLTNIDLSHNALSGEIPAAIFQLPKLSSIAAVKNCFSGTLPETICEAKSLNIISLDGLTSSRVCVQHLWDPLHYLKDGGYFAKSMRGTIPDCIWSLPNLTALHLAGNSFTGKIHIPPPNDTDTNSVYVTNADGTHSSPVPSGITPTLKNLSLSHNRLTGEIPPELLQFTFANLDLSYNKLRGHIDGLEYAILKNDSDTSGNSDGVAINLEVNRLSGEIPGSLETAYGINILTGNVFHCKDYSKLPHHDPAYHYYVCGSDELNQSMISFAVIFGIIGVGFVAGALAYYSFKGHHHVALQKTYQLAGCIRCVVCYVLEYVTAVGIQLDPRVNPVHSQRPHADKFPHYLHFLSSLTLMRRIFIWIAVCIMLFCLPVYLLFYLMDTHDDEYSTHTDRYNWISTMVFLSGQVPSITLFCIWMSLCTFLVGYVLYTFNVFNKESVVQLSMRYLSFSTSSARNSMASQSKNKSLDHTDSANDLHSSLLNKGNTVSAQDFPVRPSVYTDSNHSQDQLSSAASSQPTAGTENTPFSPARGTNTVRFSLDHFAPDVQSYVPPPLVPSSASNTTTTTATSALNTTAPTGVESFPGVQESNQVDDESSEGSSLLNKKASQDSAAPRSGPVSGLQTRPFTPPRHSTNSPVSATHTDVNSDKKVKQRTSLFGSSSDSSDTASGEKSSFSQSFSMRASEFFTVVKAKVPLLSILPMSVIFLLNAFATVTANILYVYIMYSNITSTALFLVQVSMAFFKLFWNLVVVRKLISHIPYNKGSIRMHAMMLIFNVLVAPCFASAFTDSACFRDLVFGSDVMTTSYSYESCLEAYQTFDAGVYTTMCTHYANIEYVTEYNPPFVYNYSCGSSILTSYIPVYIYSYTMLALLLPLVFLCLASVPTKYIPLSLLGQIDGIFRPQDRTESAMIHHINADANRRSSAVSTTFVQFQHIFKARSVQALTIQHLTILLTFGITSPVLACVIACAIFVDSYFIQTLMIRYVEYQTKTSVFYNSFNTSGSGSNNSGSVRDSLSSGNSSVNSSVTASLAGGAAQASPTTSASAGGAEQGQESAERDSLSTSDGRHSEGSAPRHSEITTQSNDLLIARIYEEERMSELNTICGGTWRALQHTVWLIYYCCIVFYSALLFDVVGDARGLQSAISVPISALAVGAFFRLMMSTLLAELHEYMKSGEDTELEKYKRENGFYAPKMDNFACEQAALHHKDGPKRSDFGAENDDELLQMEANRHSLSEISCAVSNLDIDTLEGGNTEPLIYDI